MVRRSWMALLVVALVAAMGLVAGCVESSDEEARTPTDAPTVANSALQTDSEGNFITAPAETAPPAEGGGGEAPAEGGGEAPAGDVDAGVQVFATNCSGCHLNNGQDAGGIGPQLAGGGREAEAIESTVVNGQGAMPGGLVSGEDLENVVAYVVSIQ
jgi:mono/diheme cytochrome c family protein